MLGVPVAKLAITTIYDHAMSSVMQQDRLKKIKLAWAASLKWVPGKMSWGKVKVPCGILTVSSTMRRLVHLNMGPSAKCPILTKREIGSFFTLLNVELIHGKILIFFCRG